MRFAISTHLFHHERLAEPHLDALAGAGFDTVELFATRSHLDYRDAAAVGAVGRWLARRSMTAWSVHLPICDAFADDRWGRAYSNASPRAAVRQEALDETAAAIHAAGNLGCAVAVLHLGLPDGQPVPADDNDAGAARRSLEAIAAMATAAGLQLAVEVIPNVLSTPPAVADWLDGDLDLGATGVCLDVGHAHLTGGAPEAVELLAGHLLTTHVHDNRGRTDDHLVPFDGTVDWSATVMALSKVGFTGPLLFEVPDHGNAERTLDRLVAARDRIRAILDDLAQPFDFNDD